MSNKKLRTSLRKFSGQKEEKLITITGELGIPLGGQKIVEVPGRNGFVYVCLKNNTSEIIQAYNSEVATIYGLPVLVTRQGNIYKVIGRNLDRYRDWSDIPYLPKHGGQHSFNFALGMGADVTWVYSQQFMPLLSYPSGTQGSMTLSLEPHFYEWQGQWRYAQNTGTPSYAPYLPTITGSARMVLSYIDPTNNSIKLVPGTPFSNSLTGSAQIAQYIPDIPRSVGIPLAAVRLVTGTTAIGWGNIYDMRDFFTNSFPTGTTVNPPITGSVVYQDDYVTKGSALVFNFRTGLLASASGTNAQIDVDFGTGTNQVLRGNTTPYDLGATPNDGWLAVFHTWTRTGNHTFTISGDVTTIYSKGTKIRYKDGGAFEYGVIYSSAFSAPNTTITLITNSDYAMAAATITDTYISYIEKPDGFPDWFNYTVSWTGSVSNPSIGDGTLYGKWKARAKSIFAKIRVIMGSTTTYGSGNYSFSIPCNSVDQSSSVAVESAAGNILDSDVTTRYAINAFVRTADMRGLYQNAILTPTAPITFAASDVINLSVEYEY